jgi:pilus assembly protein CpaE
MKRSVRVIVFNTDEDYTPAIRSDLLCIPGVQIVAEVDELALVEQAVAQFPADVLLMHLDPLPDVALPVAAQVAKARPELAVLVLSETTDGQLILAAMRAGVREFLTKPIDAELLATAFEKIVTQSTSAVEVGSLISVIGTIGGCGSSSLATNLAVELADLLKAEGGKVALIDLDYRYGQLGTMLDLQPDYTISDLTDTPEQLDPAVIQKVMSKHSSGVHLLARPASFAQADHVTAAHCATVLGALQQLYDYVIVDGPSRYDSGGQTVLELADVNLLVIQLLVTSVRNVHRMIEELKDGGYNLSRFQLVCNRVGRDSAHLGIEHVEKTLNLKVAHQTPDDWKAMSAAVNMGVPLIESAPKSKLRQTIRELAEKLAKRESKQPEAASSKGGKLGKFFATAETKA